MNKVDYNQLAPIKEVHHVDANELDERWLSLTEPTVFRGLVKQWPLVKVSQQSTLHAQQYLANFYNHKPVHTMYAPNDVNGRLFYSDDLTAFNFTRDNRPLDEVFDKINQQTTSEKPDSYYVGSTSIDHILPGFRAENDIEILKNKPLVSIWLGNQARISAHYDIPDNIACVAAGQRRFTLFPPEQLDNLYVGPLDFTPAGQSASLVDFNQIDHAKFPKFQQALTQAQTTVLHAGDAIFIPSMWWHHVESLSAFNILVNYWWRQSVRYLGNPNDALYHALLSIRDLPNSQKKAWRNIFEQYVFSEHEPSHIPKHKRGVLNPVDELMSRQLKAMLVNKLNKY